MDQNDPGFVNLSGRKENVAVLLDGVKQVYAITADTEEGTVKRYKQAEDGKGFATDRSGNYNIIETVYGKVEIFISPRGIQ
jgi:hypothetical protein